MRALRTSSQLRARSVVSTRYLIVLVSLIQNLGGTERVTLESRGQTYSIDRGEVLLDMIGRGGRTIIDVKFPSESTLSSGNDQ